MRRSHGTQISNVDRALAARRNRQVRLTILGLGPDLPADRQSRRDSGNLLLNRQFPFPLEAREMSAPRFLQDPAFKLLRVGETEAFHKNIQGRDSVDFSGTDLRGTDFRKVDLSRLVLRDAYLRDADFRGCDLRHLDLQGASLQNAKISGAYLPANISPAEIQMSLQFGTRLRTTPA